MAHGLSSVVRRPAVAAAALALVALAALLLSLSGILAPRPVGPQLLSLSPGVRSVAAGETVTEWPISDLPPRLTLQLVADHVGGEIDSGYGLVVGDGSDGLFAAVAPTGYVAVWQTDAGEEVYLVPWQTWPHIRMGAAANEIWLDVLPTDGGGHQATVRVNRELLWSGPVELVPGAAGFWLGSFGDDAAAVDLRGLTLFGSTD